MKKTIILLLALALVGAGAAVVMAAVKGTPHDLSKGSTSLEICAFCHTPHGAAQGQGPLWNRNGDTSSYTHYNSATFQMSQNNSSVTRTPGYGSMACLLCHNGQASALVNYPGPGSVIADSNYIFTMGSTGAYDKWAMVGKDLSNDHPITFEYSADTIALDTGNEDNGFPAPSSGKIQGTVGAKAWYRLYGTNKDQFECATCHAVHHTPQGSGYTTGTWNVADANYTALSAGNQVYFLRTSNSQSGMCIDCHQNR